MKQTYRAVLAGTGGIGDTHARAVIRKAGRRVAHVTCEAWQDDPHNPIATLTAHFLVAGQDL